MANVTEQTPGETATSAANRRLVRRFVADVWNGADPAAITALAAPDLVVHALGENVDRTGEEFEAFQGELRAAVPDLAFVVEDLVAEGDRVVAFVRVSGTPERRIGALAPTGRSFETTGFQRYRIEDGRIAEVWVLLNAVDVLGQLGLLPTSPAAVVRVAVAGLKRRLRGRRSS